MISALLMPGHNDEDDTEETGCVSVPDKRALKKLRDSLKSSKYGKPKWQKLRFLSEAQISERGDIVMLYWAGHPSENEVVFVKYRENLGSTANVFVQPVFGVRLNNRSDDDLEALRETAILVMDRLTEIHGVVTASGGTAVNVQLAGPRSLTEGLRPTLMTGLTVLSGVPISLNGEVINDLEQRLEKEKVERGYSVSETMSDLGRLFQWPPIDADAEAKLEAHRPKLRLAPPDDWVWAFEDSLEERTERASDDYIVVSGSDARLRDRLATADIGERAALSLEKFIAVHKATNMSLIGAWKGERALKLLLSLGLGVQFREATSDHWHVGVEINARYFRIGKERNLDAAQALSGALKKQVLLHLLALSQSCLENTKSVRIDILCPFPGKDEAETNTALDAVEEAIEEADFHTDDCVLFGSQIILGFDEQGLREELEDEGRLPRSGSDRRRTEEPDHFGGYEAEKRIARWVSENLDIGRRDKPSFLTSILN
ncbi:hypothetical protein OIU34_23835 [Pararhizobium sp. BT-229]|uniref:hypothetical protein n=1 Tax=Pararhizobium sp. BT-229 TaxID=2986923 RepID=UPI0021F7DC54|nr:hypothetical protein [Pararhizobium sp. BT-229]MCV9964929.1 hypothetical protein [Pararhizobium sp. BT-229]